MLRSPILLRRIYSLWATTSNTFCCGKIILLCLSKYLNQRRHAVKQCCSNFFSTSEQSVEQNMIKKVKALVKSLQLSAVLIHNIVWETITIWAMYFIYNRLRKNSLNIGARGKSYSWSAGRSSLPKIERKSIDMYFIFYSVLSPQIYTCNLCRGEYCSQHLPV